MFKSFHRSVGVRAKRAPKRQMILWLRVYALCWCAFASRMFLTSVPDHPACVSSLSGACDGRFVVCMLCCERSGLLGLWGCGLVSSPVIVPVRCLRAVNKVESSRVERSTADL